MWCKGKVNKKYFEEIFLLFIVLVLYRTKISNHFLISNQNNFFPFEWSQKHMLHTNNYLCSRRALSLSRRNIYKLTISNKISSTMRWREVVMCLTYFLVEYISVNVSSNKALVLSRRDLQEVILSWIWYRLSVIQSVIENTNLLLLLLQRSTRQTIITVLACMKNHLMSSSSSSRLLISFILISLALPLSLFPPSLSLSLNAAVIKMIGLKFGCLFY